MTATSKLVRKPIRAFGAYKLCIDDCNLTAIKVVYDSQYIEVDGLKKKIPYFNRIFLCWRRKAKYQYENNGILVADEKGFLRKIGLFDDLLEKYNSPYRLWHCSHSLELKLFEFDFDQSYYIIPFPADLFLSEKLGNPEYQRNPANYFRTLVQRDYPPEPCFEDRNWNGDESAFQFGTFFKVTTGISGNNGLPVKTTFLEWLGLIHYYVYIANTEKKIFDSFSYHHTESYGMLRYIKSTLEAMMQHPEQSFAYRASEFNDLNNAARITGNLSDQIEHEFIESDYMKRRLALYEKRVSLCCDNLIAIFQSDLFLDACKEVNENEPYRDWLKANCFADLITDALALIANHPDEVKSLLFYIFNVHPVEVRLAYKLDTVQLDFIKTLLSPGVLKTMLPHRSDSDIQRLYREVCDNLYPDIIGGDELKDVIGTLFVEPEKMNVTGGAVVPHFLLYGKITGIWGNNWNRSHYIDRVIESFSASFERVVNDYEAIGQLVEKETGACITKMLVYRVRTAVAVASSDLSNWDTGLCIDTNATSRGKPLEMKGMAHYDYREFRDKVKDFGFGRRISENLFDRNGWRPSSNRILTESLPGEGLFCSAVALYVAVRDTLSTIDEIEKNNNDITAVHMLQMFQAFTSGGLALSGMLPQKWLATALGQKFERYLVNGTLNPASFAVNLFKHSDRCKNAFFRKEYESAVLNAFQASFYAYGLFSYGRYAFLKLLKAPLAGGIQNLVVTKILAVTKVITWPLLGIKAGIVISENIRRGRYRTMGLISQFADDLDAKFDKDTVIEIENRRVRIPRYGFDLRTPLPPGSDTFNWSDIYRCLKGNEVRRLTMGKLQFRNIDVDKAKGLLFKEGVPPAYVAFLCGMDWEKMEETMSVEIDQNNRSISEILMTELDTSRMSNAAEWLNHNL